MEEKDGIVEFNVFVNRHRIQLEQSGVPNKFWFALHKKLEKGIFDAGDSFSIFKIDYESEKLSSDPLYTVIVTKEEGIRCDDVNQIYLIDHAWTYSYNTAESNLKQYPALLSRMSNLMGIPNELPTDEKLEKVCSEMWKYNQTYSYGFGDAENRLPLWYIMDEFGSAIQHSIHPNFRTVPFYYLRDQISYTLLFPIKDAECNSKVTRNYLDGLLSNDDLVNKALLIPWEPHSFLELNYKQVEPGEDYFLYGHLEEELPVNECNIEANPEGPLKVYTDYDVLREYLTDSNFQIVESEEDADILWLNSHFKKYKELNINFPRKFINQFPFEHVVTVKDLFSLICRRKSKADVEPFSDNPAWHPTTYNLKTEIPQFVSYYQNREIMKLDNHWICKPWNLARGLDIVVTNNLNCILRLPSTGPKIAQKYIENPVLFHRENIGWVKFDIRYVVLLKSVRPLKLYVHKNFSLRFANKPFDMSDLWDVQKHFTVMNYNVNTPLFKMLCHDFIVEFNRQNPGHNWADVERKVYLALYDIFESAVSKAPPCGMTHYGKSRALYGVDVMLANEKSPDSSTILQPKILEITWNPDCKRACQYYPTFFNDVFLLLFKDVENGELFEAL